CDRGWELEGTLSNMHPYPARRALSTETGDAFGGKVAKMLLTTREVAALLKVHPKHVYRLRRRGLPAHRVGDEWRFDEDEVRRYARDRAGTVEIEPAARPVHAPPLLA